MIQHDIGLPQKSVNAEAEDARIVFQDAKKKTNHTKAIIHD